MQIQSCLFPRCQNGSSCKTIHVKMCFPHRFIFMQIKFILCKLIRMRIRFQKKAKGNLEIAIAIGRP